MSFKPFLSLEASAGSGKTYALSVRYISLLLLGAKPSKILTLTFTNKAANEMKARINSVLKELEYRSELDDISKQTGLSKEEILQNRPNILKSFLKEDLLISTIDSFFAKILRKFSLYAGLLPDFSIEEGRVEDRVIERFLVLCKSSGKFELLVNLSLAQEKRLGDIFTLLENFYEKESEIDFKKFQKRDYINPKEILSLVSMIKNEFEKKGATDKLIKSFEIGSVDELLEKGFIKKESFRYWHYKKYATDRADELLFELKEKLKEYILSKESLLLNSLGELFSIYKRAIKDINKEFSSLSFLDVTNRLFELLQNEIRRDFLYFRLDAKIEHILIDEFQDTNIVQYKILEPLFEEIVSGYGAKNFKSLFIVGDVKQSIYRFRGGAKELFLHTKREFSLDKDVLDTNYRSSKNVVEFANEVFQKRIQGYVSQKVKSENEGYVEVAFNDEILDFVIDKVESFLKEGIKEEDIALLVHKNSDAVILQDTLKQKLNLEAITSANVKLFDIKSVGAILDLLKFAYFKDDIYKANFLVYIGKSPVEELDIGWLDLGLKPSVLISKIVKFYKLFCDDLDIVSLIEIADRYIDIEAFLFDLENINANSVNQEQSGVKILTVHKSKGLEFPYVIVVDRLGDKNNRKSSLIYEYEDIELKNIFQRVKNREFLDKDYERAKKKEELLEYEDMLNMHYVAFTRAKDGLVVALKRGSSALEYLGLDEFKVGKITPKREEKRSLEELESTKGIYRHFGLQKVESKRDEDEYESNFYAINYGLALHYCLEMMSSFDMDSLDSSFVSVLNRYGVLLDKISLDTIYKRVKNLILNQEFLEMIKNAKLYKEQPLNFKSQRYQIDLLIEKENEIFIVDYKSSKSVKNAYISQVNLYKEALFTIYEKKVRGFLIFLNENETKIVEI